MQEKKKLSPLTDLCGSLSVASRDKHLEEDIPIIALEGQSYAGKSTTIASLNQAGYGIVREYSELRKNQAFSYPHVPKSHASQKYAEEDFLLYLEIERQRYQTYEALKHRYQAVFLDRSLYTLFAYRYAVQEPMHLLSWATDIITNDHIPILFPHHILYIDIPLNLMKQRHQQAHDHLPAYFLDEPFYERFRTFFLTLQTCMPASITTIDGSQEPSSTLQQVYYVLQTKRILTNRQIV